ncbi:MAG: twin-arginine translocase TatA/TatE family subunit [Anaerolineales bacterium]|nr:twin-arginine translocase TatA/TatE family subunit [Anaerolineales bacterium]
MEFLGVGPLELLFIVFIALILLGPKDMEKTAKTIGKGLNQLVRSDTWKTVTEASRKLRTLPNELMRAANLEDLKGTASQELSNTIMEIQKPFEAWTTQPAPITAQHPSMNSGQRLLGENPPEPTHTFAAQEKSDEMTSQ